MKFNLSILLILMLSGCVTKTKTGKQVEFKTIVTSLRCDTSVSMTVYFKNHFISITDKNSFITYTTELKPDSLFASYLNAEKFHFIYVAHDTLIGAINDNRYFLSPENIWLKIKLHPMELENSMFEDKHYFVYPCCVGEFGGSIFFYDKQTKRTYSCPATCAIIVNKINNEYYVTNSLAHMEGSTEILKITDPSKLYELKTDSLKHSCNWWTQFVTDEDGFAGMKTFMVGTDTLVDSIGVITLTSFVYKDKLYNLSCNFEKTFLTTIQSNRLVTLDTIYDSPLFSLRPENKVYKNFSLYSFHNHDNSGFIFIKSDTINIITFVR